MKRLAIIVLTFLVATCLSFAQATKKTDQKATTTKTEKSAKTDKAATSGLDKGETASGKIDVNGAGQEELEKLNGIGPVTAKKIIDGRPYKTKRDLLTKKVVSQSEYDKIKDNIIAHQDASSAPKSAKAETKSAPKKK